MAEASDEFKTIIGFAMGGDEQILRLGAPVSGALFVPADRSKVLEIAEIAKCLSEEFDYFLSPEFEDLIQGKSEAYIKVKRCLESERRISHNARFTKAVTYLLESDEAYRLLPNSKHHHLDRIREIALVLTRPGS